MKNKLLGFLRLFYADIKTLDAYNDFSIYCF
jgi:hypothetical protein